MDTASSTPTSADVSTPPVASESVVPPAITTPVVSTPKEKGTGGWGALIGIILIVVLIITAAFYSWGERLATQPQDTELVP